LTAVECTGCGRTLIATPGHAGLRVKCEACGALLDVPESREAEEADVRGAETDDGAEGDGTPPEYLPAASGAVPPPRASGADAESTTLLPLAVISLVFPPLGPFALWCAWSAKRRLEAMGGEEPVTIRNARFIALVGTVLLGPFVVCGILIVLVLG